MEKVTINCSYMMPQVLLKEKDDTEIRVKFKGEVTIQILYEIDWRKVDYWEKV